MSLHDYVFNGDIIRQKEGGSIGLDLTGVVADIYMCHWDALFQQKLNQENIITKLYKRYKDDIDLLVKNEEEDGKDQVIKEQNTLKKCMQLADSIHPSIKVTGDIPSKYPDGKLPILDLKVWIGETQPGIHKVITSHYMKDVSSRAVINCRSSHPTEMKKNVMVNEVLRILRNCNEYCSWSEVASHISYFMKRLQFSGYDHQFRYEVVKSALKKKQVTRQDETPISNRWYQKKGDIDAIMFVQSTEDGKLKKELQKCADKNKMRLKMIERVDNSLRKELQKSNPFKTDTCGSNKCRICSIQNGINCRARGCIYEMTCTECDRKYRGQTGNSAQERINQHFENWKKKDSKCPLYRHSELYHEGREFPANVKVLRNCFGDPTTRRIAESILIDELSTEDTMNGKCEWTYIKLNKITRQT